MNRIRTDLKSHFFSQKRFVKIVDIFELFLHSCHLTIYLQNILQCVGGKTLHYVYPDGFHRSVGSGCKPRIRIQNHDAHWTEFEYRRKEIYSLAFRLRYQKNLLFSYEHLFYRKAVWINSLRLFFFFRNNILIEMIIYAPSFQMI